MTSLNKCDLIGNVGNEPEMRFTPNGTPVTTFSVAVNRNYITKDGEKKKDTEWFTVVAWHKLAENCNQYIKKGMQVFVSGYIHLHKWDNAGGIECSRLQLTASNVIFLESKNKNGYSGEAEYIDEETPF